MHLVAREPLHLICTDNRNKELSFLAAKDAEQAKIRQHQLEQKTQQAAAAAAQAAQEAEAENADEADNKKRKKANDPETARIKELKAKEEQRVLENENFLRAQQTFSQFAGSKKRADATTNET